MGLFKFSWKDDLEKNCIHNDRIKVLEVSQNKPESEWTSLKIKTLQGLEVKKNIRLGNRLKEPFMFFFFFLNKSIDSDSSKIGFTCPQTHVSLLTFIRYGMPKSPVFPEVLLLCLDKVLTFYVAQRKAEVFFQEFWWIIMLTVYSTAQWLTISDSKTDFK